MNEMIPSIVKMNFWNLWVAAE